jgi:hypothetical protein
MCCTMGLAQSTQSARLSLQSSELALPAFSLVNECCPHPKGGDTLACGRGRGGPNSDEGIDTLLLYRYCLIPLRVWLLIFVDFWGGGGRERERGGGEG